MNNVLITGVSKGLGLEIAKKFIDNGWKVWGVSRTLTPELDTVINEYPDKIQWKKFDLKETEKVNDVLFKEFVNFDIPLHAYINNAAIAYDDIITNLRTQPLEEMFRVNTFTPMMITKYSIRNMIYNKVKGSVIHISSISVHTGYKGLAMYASSKGALEAFSKNTAREWGERKIRSNCIVAGFMETTMSSTLTDTQKSRIYKRTSLKSETSKRSIAETALFLSSNKACSITGQNIHVDSGTI
jgi:3-oxoacyl-[acyl-carrier protein] reductase